MFYLLLESRFSQNTLPSGPTWKIRIQICGRTFVFCFDFDFCIGIEIMKNKVPNI